MDVVGTTLSKLMNASSEEKRNFPILNSIMNHSEGLAAALFQENNCKNDEDGPISPALTEGSRTTTTDKMDSIGKAFASLSCGPLSCGPLSIQPQEGISTVVNMLLQKRERTLDIPAEFLEAISADDQCSPTLVPEKRDEDVVVDDDDDCSQDSHESDESNSLDDDCASVGSVHSEDLDPLKILKKGAVAALGGTMVGVGLIMIPLPTPFGAVVASSGMAVLGTEFEGAKELNDKMISQAKTHWKTAREKIVQGIEEMNKEDGPTENESTDSSKPIDEQFAETDDQSKEGKNPKPMMNDREAKRQADLLLQAQRNKRPEFVDEWRKNAGAYLSKHLVPLLTEPSDDAEDSLVLDPSPLGTEQCPAFPTEVAPNEKECSEKNYSLDNTSSNVEPSDFEDLETEGFFVVPLDPLTK